jgi:hypothetical protein
VARLPAGPLQDQLLGNVAAYWAGQDAEAAAKWVGSFSGEEQQLLAWPVVAQNWSQSDGEGAGNWVLSLPRGRARDAALGSVCEVLRETEPERAAGLAAKIEDPQIRQNALQDEAENGEEAGEEEAEEAQIERHRSRILLRGIR